MTAYNYLCASCGCTLHADPLPEEESYYCVTTGQICSSCQARLDTRFDDYDDD
jgi:hypothetical protein